MTKRPGALFARAPGPGRTTLTAQDLAKNVKAHREDIEELKKLDETPVAKITAEIGRREAALEAFIAAVNALPAE